LRTISQRILVIRGHKVILDADLADFYNVSTKALNQAVRRNAERFPSDFAFQLIETEKTEVVTICDHLSKLKFSHQLPYAFTEHGVMMLSSVLKSSLAVQMNIFIVRAFIKMRELLATNKELAQKIDELERGQNKQGREIASIHDILKHLLAEPAKPKETIGVQEGIKIVLFDPISLVYSIPNDPSRSPHPS